MKSEFSRFIFIGIINTIFYYTLFGTLVFVGLDYRLSVLIATSIGVVFSFINFGKYVFANNNKQLIFRFVGNYFLVFFFNIYLISVIHDEFHFNYYLSGFLAMIPSTLLTYLFNKFFVFNKKPII